MATKNDGNTQDLSNALPDGMAPSQADQKAARKDGAKQALTDMAADSFKAAVDGVQPGEPPVDQYPGSAESQQYAYMLEDGPNEFDKRVNDKEGYVTDTMAAGLLKLERNGQNRTPYVKTLLKRLDLKGKDIGAVADGGPAYTNDLTSTSDL